MSDPRDDPDETDEPPDEHSIEDGSGNSTGVPTDATINETTGEPTDSGGPGASAADEPLGDLAERARSGGVDDGPDGDVMDAFDQVEVDDVDPEALWSELENEDLDETVDDPQAASERDVRVVSKRDYCQRCQFFSDPPEMRCTHESAEILEMADTEQFRVADCPILRGDIELELER